MTTPRGPASGLTAWHLTGTTVVMLTESAKYFPLEKGVYEVAPGLRPLGWNFGNGEADRKVFQLDTMFDTYHANKMACREENLSKYYLESDFDAMTLLAVNRFLVEQLATEYPNLFSRQSEGEYEILNCRLTNEQLRFDKDFDFVDSNSNYVTGFDALCSQVQEDVAVFKLEQDRDWLAAIHLSSPNHWSPEEKIGQNFVNIHQPVPGIEKINKASRVLLEGVIKRGPSVRFAWGCASDKRLNHHPQAPANADSEGWAGRAFGRDQFALRIERQVLWGLPSVNTCLFFIRTYFLDWEEIRQNDFQRQCVQSAIRSMTPESRAYKGLSQASTVLAWLEN